MEIATRHRYWRPSHALFHAFELEAYAAAKVAFKRPVLDLGCGDGTFAAMLRERGLLGVLDVALEIDPERLRRARATGIRGPVRADARALPLRSEVMGSVLANSVLNALPRGPEACLAEVQRVLAPGGLFVLTVPTARAAGARLLPRVLRGLGARAAAGRLDQCLGRRLEEVQLRDEGAWGSALECAGFRVERVRRYFTPRQAVWTDALDLPPMRVLAPLRRAGAGRLGRAAARIEERALRPLFEAEARSESVASAGTSILVVARKPEGGMELRQSSRAEVAT